MSGLRFLGPASTILVAFITPGLACSDPVAPVPQGAFNVSFGNAVGTGVTCPVSGQLQVGAVGPVQHAAVVDGESGATVTCRVAKLGAGYRASGKITLGSSQFYLTGADVGDGNPNTGSLSVAGAITAGGAYGPPVDQPCEFTVIEATEGKIWMEFECPLVRTGSSQSEQCSLYSGYLIFENCEA